MTCDSIQPSFHFLSKGRKSSGIFASQSCFYKTLFLCSCPLFSAIKGVLSLFYPNHFLTRKLEISNTTSHLATSPAPYRWKLCTGNQIPATSSRLLAKVNGTVTVDGDIFTTHLVLLRRTLMSRHLDKGQEVFSQARSHRQARSP